MSLRVVCSRLVFGEVASPNTRTSEAFCCQLTERVWSLNTRTSEAFCCKLTERVWSLWRRQKDDTSHLVTLGALSTGCNRRKGMLNIFSNPRTCIEAKLRRRLQRGIFPSPKASPYKPIQRQSLKFFQVPDPRRKLERGVFPSPKVHMKGENSEFF